MRWLVAGWWGLWATITTLFEDHKLARRGLLVWVMWELSGVLSVTVQPEVLKDMNSPASAFLLGVIGILATVLGFYVKSREREDRRNGLG